MLEEQDFYHTALLESRAAAQQQKPFYTLITISPARITENANLLDIFPFEFEANESPFLLSNAAANEQKAITAMYTEAEWIRQKHYHLPVNATVEKKCRLTSSNRQHIRVPATCGTFNKCSKKVPAFEFETEEEKPIIETFMALESTSNWADETEQQYFSTNDSLETKEPVTTRWNWCPECYALSIPLPSKSDEKEIEFGEPEAMEESKTTPIYLIENQPALQLKYFNNNGQRIKPEKAHKIDTEYDLRYPDKDTFVLKPKSLTKINLKIALEIPPGAMVQIASRSSLASKGINVREEIIDAGYTGNITVMLQNETDKPFKIEHAEKIAQVIYLLLINILGLQLVNQREQLRKSDRGIQGFGSTRQFTVPVNIALNTQNKSYQILRLPQSITISPFKEHPEIYTCPKPTITQQIFESNEQVCLKHNISILNIYITEGTKKVRVTFYNSNNYPIVLLNNLEIGAIYIPDFSKIIGHSLPKINPNSSSENYHVVMEKLSRINMGQLEPQQQNQFKELIAEFVDIFAKNNNDLGRTDLVQHQIYTGDAKLRQQQAYQVALESHQFIQKEVQRILNNELI
ncbi:hypothetical protein G9A89_017074 [Geosiphon pyriformis]|nr:hypothetical protein G9A89_017074 [Geosiphon pyriformis]